MKKWNGKKRIGRKARASRVARTQELAPGLYQFQIDAVKLNEAMTAMGVQYRILSDQMGKTLRTMHSTVRLEP